MGIARSFPGEVREDFSIIFSTGAKSGYIFYFSHWKLRKQPFLLKFSKPRRVTTSPSYANVRKYIIFSLLTKCLRRPDTMVLRAGLAHGQ